jgi:predicted  nucleic acid-binding Zn-ribbon protein
VTASLIVEILLGMLTVGVALAAYLAATRANRAQAQAATTAVDAAAYQRAKDIYEGAIDSLKDQTRDLHDQVVNLQTEVSRLRTQSADLQTEVTQLRSSNTDLRRQISILERKPRGGV